MNKNKLFYLESTEVGYMLRLYHLDIRDVDGKPYSEVVYVNIGTLDEPIFHSAVKTVRVESLSLGDVRSIQELPYTLNFILFGLSKKEVDTLVAEHILGITLR